MHPLSCLVESEGRDLVITSGDGKTLVFSALWLWDNAPSDRDAANGQKLTNITDLPADPRLVSAEILNTGAVSLRFNPDDREVEFSSEALARLQPTTRDGPELWTGKDFPDGPRATAWPSLMNEATALRDWLRGVARFGFGVVAGAPTSPGTVVKAAELFGYVRETNYGRLFDVRAVANPENLAYTGLALTVHKDNPYREPVPSLQLLHCLENAAEGGDSVLVDGFAAAEQLRRSAPDDFQTLSNTWVTFRFSSSDTHLETRAPMITVDDAGAVTQVRFNNRSLAPLDLPHDRVSRFYKAYRRFAEILFDPDNELRFGLEPGGLFIVDNRRILHGRTGFSSTGNRHLQGCYADIDGLRSRLTVLEREAG